VQGHLACLAVLAVDHAQHLGGQVDLGSIQSDGLTDPHPARGKQTDQRLVGGGLQRHREQPGRMYQGRDLGTGVQVRGLSLASDRQQVGGRDLAGRIEGVRWRAKQRTTDSRRCHQIGSAPTGWLAQATAASTVIVSVPSSWR
jgi:hypothetical protein